MSETKSVPRRAINKSTKTRIVFDENKRKEFLTGFRKRKDERRKKWNEKVERNLKEEIKRIKEQTRAKVCSLILMYIDSFINFSYFRLSAAKEIRAMS